MYRIICLFMILLALYALTGGGFAQAETASPTPTTIVNRTTHGRIQWNETWRGEIHITGDILVDQGFTLTIEPGTKVLITANKDVENLFTQPPYWIKQGISPIDDPDSGILRGEPFWDEGNHITVRIMGTLYAVGTSEQTITFTSDSPNPGIYDWNILQFNRGILSYCLVEYVRAVALAVDHTGPVEASHNMLGHHGGSGIGCMNSGPVVIENNTLYDAGHELIDMHNSSPIIKDNHIGPNPPRTNPGGYVGGGNGIVIDGGGPLIVGNTIESNQIGINFISPPGNPLIKDNKFSNNGEDIRNPY